MTRYVDIRELQGIRIDYSTLGYQCIQALSKTDVKWLVEAFGEPAEHQSFEAVWPHPRRNAVSRYCWGELHSANETARSLGLAQKTMNEWLRELVSRNLGYHKEWLERNAAREAQLAELAADIEAAWAATQAPFAVADLETTGLKADSAEVLELAAVLVEPDGSVTSEFSVLVRTQHPVPVNITRLTGITQAEVDAQGQPLAQALAAFLSHIGERPVFFHNAPFDQGFLSAASTKTKLKFKNAVHDTLPVARRAWPSLGTYKLSVLAEHVGTDAPSHRALGDARAALAVLLAAREQAK
jgi:DNA polymerase-3 subunit epsilon